MWSYSNSVPETRRIALNNAPPFLELIERVRTEMRLLCADWQDCDVMDGYRRRVYCISLCHELFDLFFNSATGYRAQYFHSLNKGLQANAQAIKALVPPLLRDSEAINSEAAEIESSWTAPSAKLWLAEHEKHLCDACLGEWSPPQDSEPDILNGRWEKGDHVKSRYGRKAYSFTKIRIFGGFIDAYGHEYTPWDKLDRAKHLYCHGWT